MKKLLCILVCAILCCGIFACCGNEDSSTQDSSSAATADSVQETVADVETFTVKAGEWEIEYPKEYEKSVKTEVKEENDGTTVSFSSGDKKLFTLEFNCGSGDVLGTIKKDGKNTIVRVSYEKLDEKDKNYKTYMAMQNAVDVIISNLNKKYDFAEGQELYVGSDEVYEIPTKVVTLCYPKQWQDKVKIEESDDTVTFSNGETKLFAVVFKEVPEATMLGTYKGTPVGVISYGIEKGKLSDHDYTTMLAMQESIDTVINGIEKQDDFSKKE